MTETEGPRRSGRSKKKPDYQDKEQQEKEEPKEDAKPKAKGKGKKNQDKKQENYKEDPESPQKHSSKTVLSCLTTLNLSPSSLSAAFNLVEEFKIIKKQYFKLILIAHPDKGGDAKSFRAINTAFESLRDLFEKNSVKTFKTDGNVAGNAPLGTSTRSWDYYFNAAESEVPIYKVELARSNRSKCVASGKANNHGENAVIPKNEIRIGSINRETGSYGRWIHLKCWRVPSKIWAGCPNPDDCDDPKMFADALSGMNEVLLSGFAQLSEEEKDAIVLHVMDRSNWAKMTNRKDAYVAVEHEDVPAAPVASIAFDPIYRDPVVENPINLKRDFVDENIVAIPRKKAKAEVHSDALVVGAAPGTLVKSSTLFSNKTVVLTGIFPEIGGGMGLSLGKDRLKGMIESMGGRVTSAISGKTDFLIVGKEPGMSKVSKAESSGKCQLVGLTDLLLAIDGKAALSELPAPEIQSFSSGYLGNGLAGRIEAPKRKGFLG